MKIVSMIAAGLVAASTLAPVAAEAQHRPAPHARPAHARPAVRAHRPHAPVCRFVVRNHHRVRVCR